MNISKILYKEVRLIREVDLNGQLDKMYVFRFTVRGVFKLLGFSNRQVTVKLNPLTGNFMNTVTYEIYNDTSRDRLFDAVIKSQVII